MACNNLLKKELKKTDCTIKSGVVISRKDRSIHEPFLILFPGLQLLTGIRNEILF